ncbi:MAG: hypothetical protein K0B87_04270 [Candidatus Syntrophosphaera sp.]|nr:hypothetical protein [Candidatus Syntrophosphaera sp.]
MKQTLSDNLSGFFARESQATGGLAILPVFRKTAPQRQYISLREALKQGAIEISEVSEGGSVPNLKVLNRGKIPVLLLDGEELRGAKQNRVLNASVLVAGESELVIPVSCTEAGRWSYRSSHFEESGNVLSHQLKCSKMADVSLNLKERGEFRSNQSRVWDGIDEMQAEHGIRSSTAAMEDVYLGRGKDLDELCASFPLLEGQCGILAEIGGHFSGLDFVGDPAVWKDIHAKIIRSYAIDVAGRNLPRSECPEARLEQLFKRVQEGSVSGFRSVGLGEDLRLEGEALIGSALFWETELVHLSAYPLNLVRGGDEYHSPRHLHPFERTR